MTKAKSKKHIVIEEINHIRVTQISSPIGRSSDQRKTLIGLGLNKMHRTKLLEDTSSVRGMINKVKHLVKVESA